MKLVYLVMCMALVGCAGQSGCRDANNNGECDATEHLGYSVD